MKHCKKTLAALLALVMVMGLMLSSCGKKEENIAPPDQVAVAMFDMILKQDASGMVDALGYDSEEAALKDFGMDSSGSMYEAVAEELTSSLASSGITVTDEDSQLLLNSVLSMMGKLQLTAEVKEMDEDEGTAVVTCHISTIDADSLSTSMESTMADLMSDTSLLSDMDALGSAMIQAFATAFDNVEVSGETADLDVNFTLEDTQVNGKTQKVWVPEDANQFGEDLSSAAMGGMF